MWANSLTSSSGTMPFFLGQGWLLLEVTDSPFMVGLGPGLGGVANMLASPFAGVLVDRLNRRTILMLTQTIMGLAIVALGLIIVIDALQIWHILLVSMVQGMMMGFNASARNTLMYDVAGRKLLMNAMAGQQMANQFSSILGPLAASFILSAFGAGPLFLGIGGVILGGAFFLIGVRGVQSTVRGATSFWRDFKDGVGFAWNDRPIRAVLWMVLITETLGFSSWTMFPVITKKVLDAGPIVLGLLATCRGCGGIVGSLAISSFGDIRPKGWVLMAGALTFGFFLLLFAISENLALSLILVFMVGIAGATYDVMVFTLLQTLSPEPMRGRVMGLQAFLVSGVFLGSMVMGAVASWLSVKWAVGSGGALVALNALSLVPKARGIGEGSSAQR